MNSELQLSAAVSCPPTTEEIDAYLRLGKDEIVRLVLCLLIEDAVRSQVASLPASVGAHAARHFDAVGRAAP